MYMGSRRISLPLRSLVLALGLLTLTVNVHAGEPPREPFLRIETGMHTAPIRRISVDAAERYLVTASHDKTARVWDLRNGKLLQILRPPLGAGDEGKLYAVAISPDGTTVAVGGWTGYNWDNQRHSIFFFDRASGRLTNRISGLPNVIRHLSYSADGRYLVAALGANNGIRIYRTSDFGEVARDSNYGDNSYWAEFERRGRLVTSSQDGYVRLYDADFTIIAKERAPGGKQPFSARLSPDGSVDELALFVTNVVPDITSKRWNYKQVPMRDLQGASFPIGRRP